jgi:hypothetical protein
LIRRPLVARGFNPMLWNQGVLRSTKVSFLPRGRKNSNIFRFCQGKRQVPVHSGIAFALMNGEDSSRFQA